MNVRAKFFVAEVTKQASMPDNVTVILRPVSRGDGNAQWASATPSGELRMAINSASAARVFEDALGQEFYLDFTPAEVHLDANDGHPFRLSEKGEGVYGHGKCGECEKPREEHTVIVDASVLMGGGRILGSEVGRSVRDTQ